MKMLCDLIADNERARLIPWVKKNSWPPSPAMTPT